MKKTLILLFAVGIAHAQKDSTKHLDEVVVSATRASEKNGMAFQNISEKSIKKNNLGQDMPVLLDQLTGVTVSSDAGNGLGYTGIRVRGTDPTRINVTINGVPQNDAESQGLYWVNMPDVASSTSSVQLQRGVGTSTNGGAAFGATLNLNTLKNEEKAYSEARVSYGSFNTSKMTIKAGTGSIGKGWSLDLRASKINSDGYIDRAFSDLSSVYAQGGFQNAQGFSKWVVIHGKEKTYQAWEGVSEEKLKTDRTFNPYQYANQTDNYKQTNAQWVNSWRLSDYWRFNPTLHYTYGTGYYEQLKEEASLANYPELIKKIGDKPTVADIITRKWLANHFLGSVFSFDYSKGEAKAYIGGGINKYLGKHFGQILNSPTVATIPFTEYYLSNTVKTDGNIYAKIEQNFGSHLTTFADVQVRQVSYNQNGTTDKYQTTPVSFLQRHTFFNPKLGLNFALNSTTNFYGSFAIGNKEPSRQDFIDNLPSTPKPENLRDFEMGYKFVQDNKAFKANVYHMAYKNQLVLTGAVNAVGEAIRVNVPQSFRRGVELEYQHEIDKWSLAVNGTLSQNKILGFKETIVNYDGDENTVNTFDKTDISFSPGIIAGGTVSYSPFPKLELSLINKYVGQQFLDNTSSPTKQLDPYFYSNFRVIYSENKVGRLKNFEASLLVNNILGSLYESNGYTYSYVYDRQLSVNNYYYPQAGTNFLLGLGLRF